MSEGYTGPTGPPPTPTVITLADILNASEVVRQKESADKAALESIENVTFDSLRTKLIQWASVGFPNAFTILEVPIVPPNVCSDGIARTLSDYIIYCSGKTLEERVAALQTKLPDIVVSFANTGNSIIIIVSKQD